MLELGKTACLNQMPALNSILNHNRFSIKILSYSPGNFYRTMADGYETYIISESESQIERLRDILLKLILKLTLILCCLTCTVDFTDHDLKISIFTDHQIFDRYHKFRIRGYFTKKESISVKELTGLNPGDYVVHIDHGIGKFGGLERLRLMARYRRLLNWFTEIMISFM